MRSLEGNLMDRSKLESLASPVQVIAVTGGKGGTGKTLILASLGYALQVSSRRVLYIDTDVAHPAVPGWSICSMRVPCAGDLRRARGGTGWLGRDR